jgi:hypothetical protein
MTAEHRRSIAKQAALRVIYVEIALPAVFENGVVVFTFAFLSRQCRAAGVFLIIKKASSERITDSHGDFSFDRKRRFRSTLPRPGCRRRGLGIA